MTAQNIVVGIDLGTTNSEIAINLNGKIEIVKNVYGDEFTPSVFGIDKSKNKIVGKRSYERLYKDTSLDEGKNNKAEIKRLMGMLETVKFSRNDSNMSPEEISAEIIKSLKEDVLRKYPDFSTVGAVITIPAYFSVLQAEATKRAGNLAGFKHVVLLQEPIAAAISYGFMNSNNENWIIYDLGGGTFDVALISSSDGSLSVLSHNGDNFLGGKDIDWLIVDKVVLPHILSKYEISDFNRGSEKYKSVFAKLKYAAETAKICLSQSDNTSIEIENIGVDDNGNEIYACIDFSKSEFEILIKEIIDRTIDLTKDTLKESGINSNAVNKIILVGGPTQIPYIKERLEKDLGVNVDSSVDPLTSVAKGACIYAISQRIPEEMMESKSSLNANEKQVKLNYELLTSELEESISGLVEDIKNDSNDYYIQVQSDSGSFSGNKVKLNNGKFFESIVLESNKQNLFWIYLFDDQGNSVPISPDSFTITHGLSISGAPIPHSIGIGVATKDIKNNFKLIETFVKIFEKGSILPLSVTETFKTVRKLKKDEAENPLWIKIGEGESTIPDRNTYICEVGINGRDLPYDLPEGTEVSISISINESRELFVSAYLPLIDLTLDARATFRDELIDINKIDDDLTQEKERAENISNGLSTEEAGKIENLIQSVTSGIQNAHLDEDEKRKASKQLKELKSTLDGMEKKNELASFIKEFNELSEQVKKNISGFSSENDVKKYNDQLDQIKIDGKKAISEGDKRMLNRTLEQLRSLDTNVIFSNPHTWVYYYNTIVEENPKFSNEKEAEYFIQKGKRALALNDTDELKRCVKNLWDLMPSGSTNNSTSSLSGITR